ncbi:MAG TPA: glycosyltransferase [Gemmatimonadaceae bacterium]|nr:glycosyltransferase [Gemmatimonadaceae bacterium]
MSTRGVTVVIATLGGASLRQTIEQLNRGTVVPDEILVCVPNADDVRPESLPYDNVRVVAVGRRGQVNQRIAGFRSARTEYVLQLDDDIYLDEDCLERLLREAARRGDRSALAPTIVYTDTRLPCHSMRDRRTPPSWLEKKIHGEDLSRPGRITRAGLNVELDFSASDESSVPTEWVPGGCVLHARKNVLLEEFYPFAGKAYGEDTIHSVHLRRKGVELFIVRDAICAMDYVGDLGLSIPGTLRYIYSEFRWRRHLVELTSGSVALVACDVVRKYGRRVLPTLIKRARRHGLLPAAR